MKVFVVVCVVMSVMVMTCRGKPSIFDFDGDDQNHHQSGEAGDAVEGSYSWTSPEGSEYYVKYVADEDGYRIVESNAVPVSDDGQAADGNQGSFDDYEEESGEE